MNAVCGRYTSGCGSPTLQPTPGPPARPSASLDQKVPHVPSRGVDGRSEASADRDHQRKPQGETQHPAIEPDLLLPRQRVWVDDKQAVKSPRREQDAHASTE